MEKNLEIKKLDDIIEWADSIIRAAGYNEEKYKSDSATAYCHVKAYELWKIRDAVLKGMERHTVYTNALNKDIADKAAKIDLLEKEIEGRKEGYYALKEKMDNVKKELEEITKSRDIWFDTAGGHSNTIIEQSNTIKKLEEKVKHQKENLDGINKTLEIRTKENERLIAVKNNQEKEIEAHESENARLSEKIIELKRTIEKCKDYDTSLIDSLRINNDDLKKQVDYLKKELEDTYMTKEADLKNHNKRDMTLVDELAKKNDEIKKLKEENSRLNARINCDTEYWKRTFETQSVDLADEKKHNKELNEVITELKEERDKLKSFLKMQEDLTRDWKNKYVEAQKEIDEWESDTTEHETITQYKEFIDGLNKDLNYWKEAYEVQSTSLAEVRKCNDELVDTLNKSSDKVEELEKQNEYLKKELDDSYKAWDKDSKNYQKRDMTLVDELAGKNEKIKGLVQEVEYYKNQERIRTDQLRATESKVDQFHKELEGYKDRDEHAKDLLNDNTKEIKKLREENSYLKKESKDKNDIIRKAYARYVDEACKGREEIMNECYEKLTKDDTGYTGFKQYTLRALEAQEGDEKKAKEFLCDSAEIIFYNKRAEEKRKEETKKELNEAFGIPCGEDAIE